ncbi:hypothetical protein V8E36_009295 [Tilletia maclaganii]
MAEIECILSPEVQAVRKTKTPSHGSWEKTFDSCEKAIASLRHVDSASGLLLLYRGDPFDLAKAPMRDAQASSESDGDSADDMQEADRELYGLGLVENPRHPMSVKTQKMAIGFAKGAVRAQGGRHRHEGVPSQKAFTTLKAELHRELGVTPIREVKGGLWESRFQCLHQGCPSTTLTRSLGYRAFPLVACRQSFANLELRQNMLLYPRRGEIISTFQDAEHYHGLPGEVSGPCAILENGEVSFVTETVLLKDRRRVVVQAWYLDSKDNIRGTAREIGTEQANEIDFALEEVEQRIGSDKHPLRQDNTPIFGVPVVIQCDDLSGVRSKKWNIHYAVSFQNAALQPEELRKESNIH